MSTTKRQRDPSPSAPSTPPPSSKKGSADKEKQQSVSSFFTKKAKTETKDRDDTPSPAAAASSSSSSSAPVTATSLGLEVREVKDGPTFVTAIRALSSRLMGRVELMVNKNRYRLVEIEYYYNAPDAAHVDTFAHGSKLQKDTCGSWYFHRQGNGAYKAGTYKGLDLTFGVAGGPHGGILIRAIQKVGGSASTSESKKKKSSSTGGELIEGPCNVVNHILTTCGYEHNDGVAQLADHINLDAFDTSSPLHFVAATNPTDAAIVASARVGLTLKVGNTERGRYIMMPYRHIARNNASSIKKFPVTIVLGLLSAGESLANITAWTGVKGAKLTQWVKWFNESKAKAAKAATNGGNDDDKDKDDNGDGENDDEEDDEDDGKKKKKKASSKKKSSSKGKGKAADKGPLSSWYGAAFKTEDLAALYGAWHHHYAI